MKVKDVLKKLKADGWYMVNQEGSHRQFKHPVKKEKVTVFGKPTLNVHPKTLKTIFKQAEWIE